MFIGSTKWHLTSRRFNIFLWRSHLEWLYKL